MQPLRLRPSWRGSPAATATAIRAFLRSARRCGLGFISPRLTAAEYGHFYESVYRPLVSAYHGRPDRRRRPCRTSSASTPASSSRSWRRALGRDARGRSWTSGARPGSSRRALGERFGAAVTVLDPAPDELAVAAAARDGDDRGLRRGLRPGGAHLGPRAALPDDRPPPGRVGHAAARSAGMLAPDGPRLRGRARRGVHDAPPGLDRGRREDRPSLLPHARHARWPTSRWPGCAVVSERLSDDGHWGFLLAPGEPTEPDWERAGRRAPPGLPGRDLRAAGGRWVSMRHARPRARARGIAARAAQEPGRARRPHARAASARDRPAPPAASTRSSLSSDDPEILAEAEGLGGRGGPRAARRSWPPTRRAPTTSCSTRSDARVRAAGGPSTRVASCSAPRRSPPRRTSPARSSCSSDTGAGSVVSVDRRWRPAQHPLKLEADGGRPPAALSSRTTR